MAAYRGGWWPDTPGYHRNQPFLQAPLYHSQHPQNQRSNTSVKVENLSKATTPKDLLDRLTEFPLVSVSIINCPRAPVNYAYLNYGDSDTAQCVVDKINGKMLLRNNLLQAKLQRQAQSNHTRYIQARSFAPKKPKDICAVKVLLQDLQLRGEDLDDHFRQYGELKNNTVVRAHRSLTPFAFVNFVDPRDAQRARQVRSHTIKGKSLVTVEFKTHKLAPAIDPTLNLATVTLQCDPLVIDTARKKVLIKLQTLDQISIHSYTRSLVVHVPERIEQAIKQLVQEIIMTQESQLENAELQLDQKFLTLLANQDVQRRIKEINVPFELRLNKGEDLVELEELRRDYSGTERGSLEQQAALQPYLIRSVGTTGSTAAKYLWYWYDNNSSLQPYGDTISDSLEDKYKLQETFELDIEGQSYVINALQMTQTNKATQEERQIERKLAGPPEEAPKFKLHITAHKDHTPELTREISDLLSKMT